MIQKIFYAALTMSSFFTFVSCETSQEKEGGHFIEPVNPAGETQERSSPPLVPEKIEQVTPTVPTQPQESTPSSSVPAKDCQKGQKNI